MKVKSEITYLKTVFPKTHDVLRIISGTVDDLTCSFTDNSSKKHTILCNITHEYPVISPIWFSESEESYIVDIIEKVNAVKSDKHLLLNMVKSLAIELFKLRQQATPSEIMNMAVPESTEVEEDDVDVDMDEDEGIEDEQDDFYIDDHLNFDEEPTSEERKEKEEIGSDNFTQLQKLRVTQRQEYLTGRVSGSVQATDRLMKELKNIYASENFKAKLYTIELKEDSNLYDWYVKLRGFDKESSLYKDLQTLYKKDSKTDHICLNITFTDRFPMQPPFIRICYPVIFGGYVLSGGAICMELLTPQGWSSAYSVEAVIMQLSATLVKGKARVDFAGTTKVNHVYSWTKAQSAYKTLVQIHEKSGWFTPPKDEG
ncbi:ubiquitin-conjugating enzyme E2 Q2-like [Hydractinia symbiolongicarpus]|uniref:ubiquitin-conjugating enzyme E2 Q2-like n=1 Tax=Hydractinia symbiolongicarpus TaxID=13093 RepID=UPI00254B7E3D|nr:ubiquitin-conjugating enzyme E2 Q2-like [Hydractinia symbiolongicarpus]